jgi:hypothetical protein
MITFKQFISESYLPGRKYSLSKIPEIKYVPVNIIERPLAQDGREVLTVSDEVAKNMDFSEPIEVTVFRFGHNNDEYSPSVSLDDGHHRVAAAIQTNQSWLPAIARARNARGEKINALIELSKQIEKTLK